MEGNELPCTAGRSAGRPTRGRAGVARGACPGPANGGARPGRAGLT